MTKKDTLLVHSVSANTLNNASKFSHNSIQGHHHSAFGIEYAADAGKLRWAMTCGCLLDPDSVAARYMSGNVLKRPILGCAILATAKTQCKNTLVIPDLHLPYQHKDSFKFLSEVYYQYGCEEVLCTGDLFDHHQGSYHEAEPDAPDAEQEYQLAKKMALELEILFPEMIIVTGNHDNIPKRKMKSVGLPYSMVSDYNALYGLAGGWEWKSKHYFNSDGAAPVLIPMELKANGRWSGRIT